MSDPLLEDPLYAAAAKLDLDEAMLELEALGQKLGEPVSLRVDEGGAYYAHLGSARGGYWRPGIAVIFAHLAWIKLHSSPQETGDS